MGEDAKGVIIPSFHQSIDRLGATRRGEEKEMEFKINKYENRRKAEEEL